MDISVVYATEIQKPPQAERRDAVYVRILGD